MIYLIPVLLGYFLGCSNLAWFLGKWMKKDLRGGGSGNLGAANATVLLGWGAGIAVAIHDIGKAILAVCLAKLLFPAYEYAGVAAGVSCVIGHIFPFYLKFKGGKGFASYIGMTIALNWKLALVVLALVLIVTVVTDYIVAGTMTTIISVPIALGFLTQSVMLPLILLVATGVMIFKHRDNFLRIRNGTETGLRSAIRGDNRIK